MPNSDIGKMGRVLGTKGLGGIDSANPCLPALECLFCIAKRIFVGSNNELVTKIAIEDRFQAIDPDFESL